MLDAAGIASEGYPPLDGQSLLPLIRGDASKFEHRKLFWQLHKRVRGQPDLAVVDGERKLLARITENAPDLKFVSELYDLAVESPERSPYARDDRNERIEMLERDLKNWLETVPSGEVLSVNL